MEIQFGPNSVDEPNLLYKIQRKLKVFNTTNDLPKRGYNLVASSSKYGLVFITTPEGMLCVYYLKQLIDKECEPQHLTIKLPIQPTHIAVNCNQEWLAVISGPVLLVYKCLDFQNQDVKPSVTMQFQVNPTAFVSSFQWNPCIADTIGVVFFDGTLLVSQVSTAQVKKIQCNARCLCWSPKGKQLVTGNSDGTLSQYKPDLSPMKMIPTPNLFEGAPVEALAIYWISTYQFAVSYRNASNNSRPAVTIVNTPKGGSPSCFNYEDICYSMGSNRPWYYYLLGIAQWNLILSSSSNSMEIATLASLDGANWMQWCQSDEARPELPLTDRKQENYPVGICIDTAAVHQLPWGENEALQPMPLMHVISQTGLLSIFNIINLNKQSPQVCVAPQPLCLPEVALSRDIPGEVPRPPPAISVPQPKPQIHQVQQAQQMQPQHQPVIQPVIQPAIQTVLQPVTQPQVQPSPPQALPPKMVPQQQIQQPIIVPKPQIKQTAMPPTAGAVSTVIKSTTPVTETDKSAQSQKQSHIQIPKPQPASAAVSALLIQQQEIINKEKADHDLRLMLIKELNDFQMELFRFMKSTREKQDKFDQDLQSAEVDIKIDIDPDQVKKDCEIEDLCESITVLKIDLVRAYAVVAETRAHAEANELQDWRQADPLTTKRLASIKKMLYYVQNQLEQSRKAMDLKWNDISRDQNYKPGERMIRPVLDDVYQPLVKQQEILCRQQAVLKTLRSTLDECDLNPLTKSTSLLRSTPFRNKDPLSKLTKNILNMSIEPQNKYKKQLLSSHKLDALKDLLSNHTPIKIKPVNVELRQHLETLKKRYEKSLKEKNDIKDIDKIKTDLSVQKKILDTVIPKPAITMKTEQKSIFGQNVIKKDSQNIEFKKEANIFGGNQFSYFKPTTEAPRPDTAKESPISVPSPSCTNIKPKPAVQSVSRTLFTDEPKEEKRLSFQQAPLKSEHQSNASDNTKSLLRKLILKDATETKDIKNEQKSDTIFTGQKICSSGFGFAAPAPSSVFSKPMADVKPEQSKQSDETGELEARAHKPKETMTNIFSMKPPGSKDQSVPDVIKSPILGRNESKVDEEPKQMIQEKSAAAKRDDLKPSGTPPTDKPQTQSIIIVDVKKPSGEAKIEKPAAKTTDSPPTGSIVHASAPEKSASNEENSKLSSSPASEATGNEPENETEDSKTAAPSDLSKSEPDPTSPAVSTVVAPPPVPPSPATRGTVTAADNPTADGRPAPCGPTRVPCSGHGQASSPAPAFGARTTHVGTTGSVFGTTTTTTTTTSTTCTTSSQSIFSSPPAASCPSSIFLGGASPPSARSLFSAAALAAPPGPAPGAVFGASSAPSSAFSSTSSVFSSPGFGPPSSGASIFGVPSSSGAPVFAPPPATQSSVFGAPPPTQSSVFGGAVATPSSVFGGADASRASVFGSSPPARASPFGGAEAGLFAAANISTTSAPSQTGGGNIFGGSSGSVFCTNNTNVFGDKSAFGTSSFGQKPAADFWSGSKKSSGFGTSTFGQPTTQSSSIFGTGSFSAPSTGGPFGSPGPFSGDKPSVFGTPTQTAPAFGASPAFGSKPVFGGSPGFGAPSFGSGFNKSPSSGFGAPASFGGGGGFGTPAFGNASPSKMFGNSSPGFGSPPQPSNSTFENLATQNTLTFGKLAQQSPQPNTHTTGFNTSPSFTGWRG